MIINLFVCLSDIPEDKIKVHTNGKKYISLTLCDRKTKDSYDHTHTLFVSQTKQERAAKDLRVFVGNGKEVVFAKASSPSVEDVENMPVAEAIDDLPF